MCFSNLAGRTCSALTFSVFVLQCTTGNCTTLCDRWLRAAYLQQDGREDCSQVAVPIKQIGEEDVPLPVIKQLLQDLLELQEDMSEVTEELTMHLRPLLSQLPTSQDEDKQEVRFVGRHRVSFRPGNKEEMATQHNPLEVRRQEYRRQRESPPQGQEPEGLPEQPQQTKARENWKSLFRDTFGGRTFADVPTGRDVPFSPTNATRISYASLQFSPYTPTKPGQSSGGQGSGVSHYEELMNLLEMGVQLTDDEKFALAYLEQRQGCRASSSSSKVVAIAMPSFLAWEGVRKGHKRQFHADLQGI